MTVAAGALALLLVVASCGMDAAEREYMTALQGEETGMGRERQIEHIERAIAMRPDRAWYRETHAIYSIDVKRYEVAAADLDTAIQLADRPYLRFLRGLVTCERGLHEASLRDFDRAIAEQPKNSQFYRGRSLARSAVGRYAPALEDAEQLLKMVPQQGETYYALGVAQAGLGRLPEAISNFDESLRRRPELIYPLHARSAAYASVGDSARAAADLEAIERRMHEASHCALCVDPFRY